MHSSIARAAGATGHLVAAPLGHGAESVQRRSDVAIGAAGAGQQQAVPRPLQGARP
jgi:hypothetical protein